MSDELDLRPVFENTHNGVSVFGVFRWLSNLVYGACWIVALPAELVLNRRVGARYAGLVPAALSFCLVGVLFSVGGGFKFPLQSQSSGSEAVLSAYWTMLVGQGVFLLALWRNRLASWWRFRSEQQVHSLSNGVPFWLNPPRFASETVVANSSAVRDLTTNQSGDASVNAQVIRGHVSAFAREWASGEPPTGPLAWFLATVLHPALLVAASIPLVAVSPVTGYYAFLAGVAIFVKARVQKALVVEKVYDIFDSRLEHEFTQALGNPVRAQKVERAGMLVPGVARILGQRPGEGGPGRGVDVRGPNPLPPDLHGLIARPSSVTEPKPSADHVSVTGENGQFATIQLGGDEQQRDRPELPSRAETHAEPIVYYGQSGSEARALLEQHIARCVEQLRRGVSMQFAMTPADANKVFKKMGMDVDAVSCPGGCLVTARQITPPPIPIPNLQPVLKHGIGSGGIIGPTLENVSVPDSYR